MYKRQGKNVKSKTDYLVFGTGGNINKIHKLLGKKGNESIPVNELKDLSTDLSSMSLSKRISKYKLKPDRADVIVPASKIFLKIIKKLDCEEILVPKIGLSDGMIHQLHRKHSAKK